MSALDGGFNGSTQHSISFFLLGFESQGLAHIASDPKVPGFSAAVKPLKKPRRFVIHSVFPLQDRECCVDRLNRQSSADIVTSPRDVRFTPRKRTFVGASHSLLSASLMGCEGNGLQRTQRRNPRQHHATLSGKGEAWFWPKIAAALVSKLTGWSLPATIAVSRPRVLPRPICLGRGLPLAILLDNVLCRTLLFFTPT
jgi:hypothetical protein